MKIRSYKFYIRINADKKKKFELIRKNFNKEGHFDLTHVNFVVQIIGTDGSEETLWLPKDYQYNLGHLEVLKAKLRKKYRANHYTGVTHNEHLSEDLEFVFILDYCSLPI